MAVIVPAQINIALSTKKKKKEKKFQYRQLGDTPYRLLLLASALRLQLATICTYIQAPKVRRLAYTRGSFGVVFPPTTTVARGPNHDRLVAAIHTVLIETRGCQPDFNWA